MVRSGGPEELTDQRFPFVLTTGRTRTHYQSVRCVLQARQARLPTAFVTSFTGG